MQYALTAKIHIANLPEANAIAQEVINVLNERWPKNECFSGTWEKANHDHELVLKFTRSTVERDYALIAGEQIKAAARLMPLIIELLILNALRSRKIKIVPNVECNYWLP